MSDDVLQETLERLFSEQCSADIRQTAERSGWIPSLWEALEQAGFTTISVPEAAGGAGGGIGEAATLLRAAGHHAVPLPLAESTLLGGWLLAVAGLEHPGGPLGVAVPSSNDHLTLETIGGGLRLRGRLARVPFASQAGHLVALVPGTPQRVVLVPLASLRCETGHNLAGEPKDAVVLDDAVLGPEQVREVGGSCAEELRLRGALSRSLLLAGALQAVSELTVGYAQQRQQFGRPIASFQAVANRLVQLASEAELAILAAGAAAVRFEDRGVEARFEVASAKVTCARAATEVATHAHQVHGAMGMTQDYPLHHFTRRLWSWRQEWGSASEWSRTVGGAISAVGADSLWPVITGRVPTGAGRSSV